ncbi:hypothetical protein BAE36_25055 [Rhizobium leguminosarum bv. trifolii]|uniref:hypothetical protein n=1 Tax=Rhizobium TaxID=379 RepID=UPI0008031DC1|nr:MULTISPECIES: hypothetical protein [Rhizobium]OBY04481.1 hypothetical protein BAE36_25055 [Rhizobium leguminosarum bv. trifolii]WSG87369.1 hypothetical protein U8P73_15055 [Rhizobium beringeri]
MVAKYVDLRGEADVVVAKQRIITEAMLLGIEVNSNVSRTGVMLCGDEDKINVFLHFLDGRDVPLRPYDPAQTGDTREDD